MNKLHDVALLRTIAIISLVAWHSYCAYICWDLAESPINEFYTILFAFLTPDANMPLFTFISGYLFCYLVVFKGKYGDFKSFLKNKVNRLLIPYIVLGFTINMTQIGRQNPVEILTGTPNHLWYCLMLFYCFIACWIIEKWNRLLNIWAMCISLLLVLVVGGKNIIPTPLGIYMPLYYYGYFYMGFMFFKYKDKMLDYINKYMLLLLFTYVASSIVKLYVSQILLINTIAFLLIIMWFSNLEKIHKSAQSSLCVKNSIELIGRYSFGIYVFHQWMIWNITRYPGMSPFLREHYIMFPLLLFVSVFFVSMLLTHISLKTRLGRYLLL